MNTEIICVYLDLDKALDKVQFTTRQKTVLCLYMKGWTEQEIGNKMGGINRSVVCRHLQRIVKKIQKYLICNGQQKS